MVGLKDEVVKKMQRKRKKYARKKKENLF